MRSRLILGAALVLLGLVAASVAGAFVASRQAPEAMAPLLAAAAVTSFGALLVVGIAWRWLDTALAAGVDRLAGEMRARAHAAVAGPIDPRPVAALGDLGPAASALAAALAEERAEGDARLSEATEALEAERRNLVEILSEIPVAILVADAEHRLLLYDRQSVHALAGVATLVLGRSVFDYLAEESIREVLARLDAAPERHFADVDLPTADGSCTLRARVQRTGPGRGYTLAIEVEDAVLAERPLVFDFSALPSPGGDVAATPLAELRYAIFDTETTGLDPERDRLVQIGAVRGAHGRRIEGETFETLVDPGGPIPASSSRVHGITDETVTDAPGPVAALAAFHHFARDAVLVAHNAPFDLAFLRRQGGGIRFDHPVLDTVLLSAAVFGEDVPHTLDAIAARLDVPISAAERHTAMGDAVATADVLFRLLQILDGRGVRTFGEAVAAMRRHERLLGDPNRAQDAATD